MNHTKAVLDRMEFVRSLFLVAIAGADSESNCAAGVDRPVIVNPNDAPP